MKVARAWGDRGRITGWWIWFVMVLCWRATTPESSYPLSCSCMARRVIGVLDQQLPRFSAAHRVIAVDLRGHGESDAPKERYMVRLFADDLVSTCTQLGIESPVVIGRSLGGLVTLDFASAYRRSCRRCSVDRFAASAWW